MDIASHACARPIEAQAPIDYEWMDRPFTGLFQEADPSDDKSAVVIYRGDSIRFQTPDKAWIRVTYECAFDADAKKVVVVRARPGRINQPAQLASAPPAKKSGGAAMHGSPQKVNGEALAAAISQAVRNRQQPAPKSQKTVKFGETSPIEVKQIETGQTP